MSTESETYKFIKKISLNLSFLQEQFSAIAEYAQKLSGKYDAALQQSPGHSGENKILKKIKRDIQIYEENLIQSILPGLAEKIIQENPAQKLSDIQAFEILRREHVIYLGTLFPKEGIQKKFEVSLENQTKNYTSSQVPVINEYQLKFQNCYERWKEGLPAFRHHTLVSESKKILDYYHHSSPVPYEVRDYQKRIELTSNNFNIFAQSLPDNQSITEIRLISPSEKFQKVDHDQVLDTYLGALRSGKNINVFVYGVNIVREFYTESGAGVQTWINTQATNSLFKKVFLNLNLNLNISDQAQVDINAIETAREKLKHEINQLNLSEGEESIREKLKEKLENHHEAENRLLDYYQRQWDAIQPSLESRLSGFIEKQRLIFKDMNDFLKIKKEETYKAHRTRRFNIPEYNGQIQSILIRLNTRLGDAVGTGCNDAKDRDGMVSLAAEACEIFKDRYGRYPYVFEGLEKDKADREKIKFIQKQLAAQSTPALMAEMASLPYLAKGLDNSAQFFSGFRHLENDGTFAGMFKRLYHPIYSHHHQNTYLGFDYDYARPKSENTSGFFEKFKHNDQDKIRITDREDDPAPKDLPERLEEIITLNAQGKFETYTQAELQQSDNLTRLQNTPNKIEIFQHKISYQPRQALKDEELLQAVIAKIVEEAIKRFEPRALDDLYFQGSQKLIELAKKMIAEKLEEKKSCLMIS